MTTISPSRRRTPVAPTALLILLLLLIIGIAILWRSQLSALLWRVVTPLVAVRNSLDQSETTQLEAELASTSALIADRDMLYEENLALKAELGRQISSRTVLAGVLQGPPGIPYDTLIIDVGTQNGVVAGDVVSAGGTTAIGEVSNAYDSISRVTLYSASGQTYQALLMLSSGTTVPITIEGQGAGSMDGTVPAGTAASVGDTVMFPGIAGGFIGSVSQIVAPSGQSFETMYINLPVDLFSLQYVEVELPSN